MSSSRFERLRDRLLARSAGQTVPPLPHGAGSAELSVLVQRVRPFAEAMYLVISADAAISARERDVLRGALRTLTEDRLGSEVQEAMLTEFEQLHARDGVELRLDAIASEIYADRRDAELALVLAIIAADVDGRLEKREREVVAALAQRLGVKPSELDTLLLEAQSQSR